MIKLFFISLPWKLKSYRVHLISTLGIKSYSNLHFSMVILIILIWGINFHFIGFAV